MFNNYIWKIYLDAGGKSLVDFFQNSFENEFTQEYAQRICELHKSYCPSKYLNDDLKSILLQLLDDINSNDLFYACYSIIDLSEGEEYSIDDLLNTLFFGIKTEENQNCNQIFEEFSVGLPYYTTFLSLAYPEKFVPYYFKCNFNILIKIADEFSIELPELPLKKDYKDRFFYYARLCEAFYDFRIENNMSPYEFFAFLYDFAPKYIGGVDSYIIRELPPAKSAYFIGGERNDIFLSNEENIITPWQCNPETLAGDNIVLYLKSPVSSIDSIWRSVSIGFIDPFFYYYRCTYISNAHKIRRISLKQLEKDIVFRTLPIVRKNMQGVNGVELYPSAYNHLIDISKTDLPKLEYLISDDSSDLSREKDVENKLVKPFLEELGYSEDEYVQQLYIEIGNRNHALIPDFVIHPQVTKGHQSAEFLIEAKYSVKSEKDFEEYKSQARSYANQLKVKYSVIASKEGIWVSSEIDDFSDDFIIFSWKELRNEDVFFRVMKVLGNGNVKNYSKLKKLQDKTTYPQ